jgi:hypothetical protein
MAITLTAEQRNIIYGRLLLRLGGIDGIVYAANEKDFDRAERLGREFADLLVVLGDLGFGAGTGAEVEVTASAEVFRRVLERVHDGANTQADGEGIEIEDAQTARADTQIVLTTCESLLATVRGREDPLGKS